MVALTSMGNMRSQDALANSHRLMQVSLERLSTGVRINRAEDDAAGLIVRDRFQAQMNGFDEAIRNIQTAQSMIQVAEQGINKITDALQVMRSLAVRAADDNLNDDDRERIQLQVKGLLREINERAVSTTYNGHKLLDGSITDSHEERLGDVKVQSNSFLANGFKLIDGASVVGQAATSPNAISQGSYEVKIVFSGESGILPSMTAKTTLAGTINSPSSAPNSVSTVNQNVVDRNGGAHSTTFTFTQLGTSRNYSYQVDVAGGGVYGASTQSFTGTLLFGNDGELLAADGDTVTPFERTVSIADGTSGGQSYTIDFSGLMENVHDATATTVTSTSNGSQGTPTTAYLSGGNLEGAHVVSDSVTTSADTFVDRIGAAHSVSVTYTKIASDASGDTWSYSFNGLNGGAWTGANSGNVTGTVHFDTTGALDAINGGPVGAFNIVVGDGSSAGQTISVDLTTLSQTVGGGDTLAQAVTGTTTGNPTTSVVFSQNLVSGQSPQDVYFEVYDRTGTEPTSLLPLTQQPRVTFSQIGTSNVWNYTITAPNGSSFNGFGSNLQGQVTFDDAGNLVDLDGTTTLNKNIVFNDGTPEGQTINMDFAQINMGRADNLAASSTDGGSGTSTGTMNAIVYYSDDTGQTDLNPVSTLLGIDLGQRTYSAGGISFTVNTASSLNVGLVGYIKAYTYISATKEDKSLEFQVGPDEGMVMRLGIQKMDVQTLFRRTENNFGDSIYTDINLSNTLKAQDLIGQLDDALDFVSAENLKVGQFQNNMTRTLELARQTNTSVTNAYSLLNDADMAKEATSQSKRSILIQSGTAMVAQANSQTQFLLQLLR